MYSTVPLKAVKIRKFSVCFTTRKKNLNKQTNKKKQFLGLTEPPVTPKTHAAGTSRLQEQYFTLVCRVVLSKQYIGLVKKLVHQIVVIWFSYIFK